MPTAWGAHFVPIAHKVNQGSALAVSTRNSRGTMRNSLKRPMPAVDTQRALQREALHELDDGQIVMRHLTGESQAFGTLVDRYQTRLLNFVNRTIGDRERAEDLVQEVFIRVFRHLHRFDQTKKFSTWI
ncbi:MAG: hypothetical protein DMD64_06480, partial [Gemmatimonadetes bacterium]